MNKELERNLRHGFAPRMNLQLFAEPAGGDGGQGAGEGANQQTGGEQNQQTGGEQMITMAEVMKMIQSEADRRVNAALAKQKKEFDKQMSLSGLDEQQRALTERDNTIEELNERIRTLTIRDNKAELVKTLANRGLPVEFADVIEVGEDAQAAQKKVEALDAAFKQAVERAVAQRLSGGAPGRGAARTATMTKDQIMAIRDHGERQKAIAENMELFRKG